MKKLSTGMHSRPRWSIELDEDEKVAKGMKPYEILFLPDDPSVIKLENSFFNNDGRERLENNDQLEKEISQRILKKKAVTAAYNRSLLERLKKKGMQKEAIEKKRKKFFDATLARLHPKDIIRLGKQYLLLKLGTTRYFTYAGTRKQEYVTTYSYDRLSLPLAVCSVVIVHTQDGTRKVLYTKRSSAHEIYSGWFHAVGGTVKTIRNGIADPHIALEMEIREELGLERKEFKIQGILGCIMNYDVHPELLYITEITVSLEEWLGKRETDGEVKIKLFTDTQENLEAFILGKMTKEFPDARPIVPSGLACYLFYGRLRYGEKWYNDIFSRLPRY